MMVTSAKRQGGLTRLAAAREQVGKVIVGKDRPESISEREIRISFGECRARNSSGFVGYGLEWSELE
jgi:hypothetical protein